MEPHAHPRLGEPAVPCARGAPLELDLDRPIAVICAAGHRSAVGASLIKRRGATAPLHVVDGGISLWGDLGQPLETGRPAEA